MKILDHFETHNTEAIRQAFINGLDPNMIFNGQPLVYELINMYLRSPAFKDCLQIFVDFGLTFGDEVLLSVLLNDDKRLQNLLKECPELLQKKYTLACTFTPLVDVSLLHICAEYNHVACAKVLLNLGLDVNTKAGLNEYGFNGHTAIFHTVNQHNNACSDMMHLLVEQGAALDITVKGLIWGKGYEWETFIPAVNPISYAIMGMLKQFQRTERHIYENVHFLMKAAYGFDYQASNVPNRYLV